MAENIEETKYEPYDDTYFTLTRSQLKSLEFMSLFSGYPYEAPFFGYGLVDGKPHPYASHQLKEWEEKHGPLPPITIIEDLPEGEEKDKEYLW